jgi:hypothetical protein
MFCVVFADSDKFIIPNWVLATFAEKEAATFADQ